MILENILLSKHSKGTTNLVIRWVGTDKKNFKSLMLCVLGENTILAQRAAWAMSYIVEKQPQLIYPYLNQLLNLVQQPVHVAIKRNTFRFLKEIDIPEKYASQAIDACFSVLTNKDESIAVICFALNTLLKLGKKYPEIKNEILFATEMHEDNNSTGVKHTLKKIQKALK